MGSAGQHVSPIESRGQVPSDGWFALMSYRNEVDMVMIRTMIAFAILEGIKNLTPPKWPTFTSFRSAQAPSVLYLKALMDLTPRA